MRKSSLQKITYYILLFFVFSLLGGILEISYSLIFRNKLVIGGFMYGIVRPIYGFASIILYIIPRKYHKKIIQTFILSFLIGSIYEYLSSFLLEQLFHKRWWDYSNFFLNINGRICIINSIIWGILGILFYYILEPLIKKLYNKMNKRKLKNILLIGSIYYIIDTLISFLKYFSKR